MSEFNLGDIEAPSNTVREYLKPGYRKLLVKNFTYEKEEEGKTPLLVMHCVSANDENIEFNEKIYLSGKVNTKGVPSALVRLQELYKGLTGEPKITGSIKSYTYTKKERDGSSQELTIPDPEQICALLNKKCVGKTSVFRVGGEETEDGKVYTKLDYSGFLYYNDRDGNLVKYTKEADFNKSEYSYSVRKRKSDAPTHNEGIVNISELDAL